MARSHIDFHLAGMIILRQLKSPQHLGEVGLTLSNSETTQDYPVLPGTNHKLGEILNPIDKTLDKLARLLVPWQDIVKSCQNEQNLAHLFVSLAKLLFYPDSQIPSRQENHFCPAPASPVSLHAGPNYGAKDA